MSRELLDLVGEWEQLLFAATEVVQKYTFERSGFSNVLVWRNDELVSFLTTLKRAVSFDGHPVVVGGVSSLMTPREHQGKGYASLALREAERIIFEEIGADCGALLCAEHLVPFYSGRGWQTIACPVEVRQPTGKVLWSERMMVLPKHGVVWSPQTVDLCGLPF